MSKSKKAHRTKKAKKASWISLLLIPFIAFVISNYDNVKEFAHDFFGVQQTQSTAPTVGETYVNKYNSEGESSWGTEYDSDTVESDSGSTNALREELDNDSNLNDYSIDESTSKQYGFHTENWENYILPDNDNSDLSGNKPLESSSHVYFDKLGISFSDETIANYPDYRNKAIAFSLRTTITNSDDNPIRLERLQTELLMCEPIYNEDVRIEMAIGGGKTLKFYAVNNGWSNSKIPDVTYRISYYDNVMQEMVYAPITEISQEDFCIRDYTLKTGEIFPCAQFEIDSEKYLAMNRDIRCEVIRNNESGHDYLCYNDLRFDGEQFWFEELGWGDITPTSAKLFAVLDVDDAVNGVQTPPYVKTYTSSAATPQINAKGTYSIETVIAPTKSCHVRCRNNFYFGNLKLETPSVELEIIVPAYTWLDIYTSEGFDSPLFRELAEMENPSEYEIRQIAKKYRYRAEDFKVEEYSVFRG